MDTGTSTLGNTILNRYPALNTLTHQATDYKPGRVPQNFQRLKMEISNKEAFPDFYTNVEATLQMDTPKISVQTQDNLSNLKMDTNMNANHMTTIQQLMSEHCYGSISNRSA